MHKSTSLVRLLTLVALLLLPLTIEGRERVSGWCEQGGNTVTVGGLTSTESVQQSFPSCVITVYDVGTLDIADIFSDDSGTIKANPFTASSTGFWFFLANDARYDVRLSGGGIVTPFTIGDILLDDTKNDVTTIVSVASSATPTFDASLGTIFTNTLTANVTSSTISNPVTGQRITIYLAQDGTGGWTFAWPANVQLRKSTYVVSDDISAVSTIKLYYDGTNWRETGRDADEIGYTLTPVGTVLSWSGTLAPVATGQDIGASGTRPDGIFDTIVSSEVNNVLMVDGNRYACTAAGVQAAIDALPSTGGHVDASGCEGAQTLATDLNLGSATKPVKLSLGGAVTWTLTSPAQIILFADSVLEGSGHQTLIQGNHTTALVVVGAAGAGADNAVVRDLAIDNTSRGNAGGVGIAVVDTLEPLFSNLRITNVERGFHLSHTGGNSTLYGNLSHVRIRLVDIGIDFATANTNAWNMFGGKISNILDDGIDVRGSNTRFWGVAIEGFETAGVNGIHIISGNGNGVFGGHFENVTPGQGECGVKVEAAATRTYIFGNTYLVISTPVCNSAGVDAVVEVDNLQGVGAITSRRLRTELSTGADSGFFDSTVVDTVRVRKTDDSDYADMILNEMNVDRYKATGGSTPSAGDFSLSAGWGTTGNVGTISGTDARLRFTVNSSGSGQGANPTVTYTFKDGTWTTAPFAIVSRNGGDQAAVLPTWTITATTLVITFPGTPVAGESFIFEVIVIG